MMEGFMKTSVESFLCPKEVLDENQNLLIDRYVEDYGNEYRDLIRKRMDNTLYLFDSNPIVTMKFIQQFGGNISSSQMKLFEKEYRNYKKVFSVIHERIKKQYYQKLASYFSISSHPIKEEILSLDIESFSLENQFLLKRSDVCTSEKEKIIKRQEKYLEECEMIGVEPLTNSVYIQFLLDEKRRLEEYEDLSLLKNTKWGRRIVKTIRSYYPKIRLSEIQKIMRDDAVAVTSYLLDSRGCARARILYFPLLEHYSVMSLDRIFYHENRHVVESNPYSSGLHSHVGSSYQLLNEIRTEKNALDDLDYFPHDLLWSSDSMVEGYHNTYEELYSYISSFLEEHREVLNDCAIRGDLLDLEEKFGKKNLKELEMFLDELSGVLKQNHFQYSSTKREEGKRLIYQLNQHFHGQ